MLQVVYNRMDHVPYTLEVTINSSVATLSIVRVFLISVSRPSIVIEMDKWLAQLSPGQNTITRYRVLKQQTIDKVLSMFPIIV